MSSSAEDPFDPPDEKPYDESRYAITSRIMITAIIILVLAVWLAFSLHVYAGCIWRQSARFFRRRQERSPPRGRPFHFTGQEPSRLRKEGLDSAIIETLPMFVYKSQNFRDGLDCAVCLCALEENEKARLLPNCGHSFHVDCVDMWFLSHTTCPLCRTAAQPQRPVLESVRIEHVLATTSEPIASEIHENLNSEQGHSASFGEDFNLQNTTTAVLSSGRQEEINVDMDEGTLLTIEISRRPDGFSSLAYQSCSPNDPESS